MIKDDSGQNVQRHAAQTQRTRSDIRRQSDFGARRKPLQTGRKSSLPERYSTSDQKASGRQITDSGTQNTTVRKTSQPARPVRERTTGSAAQRTAPLRPDSSQIQNRTRQRPSGQTRRRTNHSDGSNWVKFFAVLVPVICIVAAVFALKSTNGAVGVKKYTSEQITEGVNYLQTLEQTDVTEIQDSISNQSTISEISDIENGTVDVWSQFSDAVVIGDSRAIGFSYYDFLPEERVLAHYGAYLYEIEDYYMDSLIQLNPKYVFIAIGINDIGNGVWASFASFGEGFCDIMDDIHAALPNAVICANSVLTCVEPALSEADMWYEIPDYNEALRNECEAMGYTYIDNDALCEELSYLYEPDGIHVQYDFYEPWAINMIKAVA